VTPELNVIREIDPNDPMFRYAPERYFVAGERALECIRLAMAAAELDAVDTILDFASGGGRVLRTLKAAFPDALLTACDTDARRVQFCADVLGARGIRSRQNPMTLDLGGPFDVIWSGSLFSHLAAERFASFLKLFESVLSPRGVIVFTAYGRYLTNELRTGVNTFNLTAEQIPEVLQDHDRDGFGFAVTFSDENGDAFTSRTWICDLLERELPDLRLLLYYERGWLDQDVIALTKSWAAPLSERRELTGSNPDSRS
jgi:SAM-dependent methyltransferase